MIGKKVAIVASMLLVNLMAAMPEERFPADYFLVHKNLPHYMNVFREFDDDAVLQLSVKQKTQLQTIQEHVVLVVSQKASKIKDLELQLKNDLIFKKKPLAQLNHLVEEIAQLRKEASIIHVECIQSVQAVLTQEQHQFFITKLGVKQ